MAEPRPDNPKPDHAPDAPEPEGLDPELPIPRGADEVASVLEALLFAATAPLNVKRLAFLMNGVPEEEVAAAIETLRTRYHTPTSGLVLMEVAGGYQVATRPEVADWVLRLHKHRRRAGLSPSLLESLAIVAYKQPITRAEIEQIRGVDCGTGLRGLQDAGLIEIVGRKETLGKPPLYGTTELFLKTFGLKDLAELPTSGDLKGLQGTAGGGGGEEKAGSEMGSEAPASPAQGTAG